MTIAETLDIDPLSPTIGARVTGVDLRRPIVAEIARALKHAFTRHAVLCLPGQRITPQQQIAFALLFGRVDAGSRSSNDSGAVRSDRGVIR